MIYYLNFNNQFCFIILIKYVIVLTQLNLKKLCAEY